MKVGIRARNRGEGGAFAICVACSPLPWDLCTDADAGSAGPLRRHGVRDHGAAPSGAALALARSPRKQPAAERTVLEIDYFETRDF